MRILPVSSVLLVFTAAAQSPNLHRDAFVMDAHVHMINRQFFSGGDIGDRYADGQVDLPRIRAGGLDAFLLSLFPSEQYYVKRFEVKHTLRLMDLALQQIEKNRETIGLALRASDIEHINKEGKIAAILDIEGAFDLDGDLGVLRNLYRLGLRSLMLPAHNFTSNIADSCCAPSKWNGINDRGRALIKEMNRLGMMINVAHGSEETIVQAVEASSDPIIFSHGGSRHFVETTRNISDNAARKIASKGGVVALHFGHSFHSKEYFEWRQKGRQFGDLSAVLPRYAAYETIEALDAALSKRGPSQPMRVPDEMRRSIDNLLIPVIDHWVNLLGEDHVALGSDLDGGPELPREMKDISDYPQITQALVRKGYSEQRIRKILGLNLLRVFRAVTEK